ncbi:MAG: hypothetical protein H6978_07175 [Gammaproteobacteria bacterium]|nr:hypothetical protein [Gammaproteobacteria bacterium]
MSEAIAGRAVGTGFRPSFHLWMIALMTFFVFGGFGMTYLQPMATGTMPPTPPIVHVHGIFFFTWMVLLVVQSLLVNVKNVRLHRSLGSFGIALAGTLVFMGLLITVISTAVPTTSDDGYGLLYLSLVAPPSFGVLFAMAIRSVRTPEIHRNLMLLSTISILMPGINRLYMMGLGLDFVPFFGTYMTMNAMSAAVLVHEWRSNGRISGATWTAVAIIVIPQILLPMVAPSHGFREFCDSLGSLVYYR